MTGDDLAEEMIPFAARLPALVFAEDRDSIAAELLTLSLDQLRALVIVQAAMPADPAVACDARDELEATVRRAFARHTRSLAVNEDVDAILADVDAVFRYEALTVTGLPVHLAGAASAAAACQYGWAGPLVTARNPARVTCGNCLRSRLYRDLTAEAEAA